MILALFFSCAFLASVSGQPAPTNTQCRPMNDNIPDAVQSISSGLYNPAQFTKQCLATTCPGLSSAPCPYVSGSTNKTQNASAVAIIDGLLSTCLQGRTTLCNTTIQNIPITCDTGLTVQGLINSSHLAGNISLVANTGTVSGLPSFVVTFDPTTGYFTITVTLVYKGQAQGYIGVPNNPNVLHLNNVTVNVSLKLILVTAIDPTNMAAPVKLVSSTVSKQTQFDDLLPNSNVSENQQNNLKNALESAFNQTVAGSPLPQLVANFIGTMLAATCLVAEDNCSM